MAYEIRIPDFFHTRVAPELLQQQRREEFLILVQIHIPYILNYFHILILNLI